MKVFGFVLKNAEAGIHVSVPRERPDIQFELEDSVKTAILAYLARGAVLKIGFDKIPHPKKPGLVIPAGSTFTDGEWWWSSALPYYVAQLDVGVPKEFLERVLDPTTQVISQHEVVERVKAWRAERGPQKDWKPF